jgi:hypothetical protein
MKRTTLGFALLASVGCGYRGLPPLPAPAPEIPRNLEASTTLPAPGTTRVLIDANGDRATVTEVLDSTTSTATAYSNRYSATVYGYSETTRTVCIAPCVADFSPGAHVLRFRRTQMIGKAAPSYRWAIRARLCDMPWDEPIRRAPPAKSAQFY